MSAAQTPAPGGMVQRTPHSGGVRKMRVIITCTVPEEWRDDSHESGVLEFPSRDIETALRAIGAEDIDIHAAGDE